MTQHITPVLVLLGAGLLGWVTSACAPVTTTPKIEGLDAAKAKSLAAEDHCLRCHGLSREKEGPSYAEIAAKYRGRPDAESVLYGHLTSGQGPVDPDGHVESHRIIKAKSPEEIANVVRWILAQ